MAKKRQKKEGLFQLGTIVAIMIVIAVTFIFIRNMQTLRVSKEYTLFQYVMGKRKEYSSIIEMTKQGDITKLETKEGIFYLDSIPIYFMTEKNKAIVPVDMAIAFPMNKGTLNKINSLSTIYIEDGDVFIQTKSKTTKVTNAFLYDGNDLYFFVENTNVNVNGVEYKLPPLSYVQATYKGYVEIYNYDTEEYTYIENVEGDVKAKTSDYTINLSNDTLQYEETEQLLIKRIKNLPNLDV